jgi:putative ABC transport system substrate-binding protein
LASELVNRKIAVIATPGSTPAALAAKAATSTIPIVFAVGGDPVGLKLVDSLNRPGKNITGIGFESVQIAGKSLGILRELLPKASRVIAVLNPGTEFAADLRKHLRAGAAASGFNLEILEASNESQLAAAFEEAAQQAVPLAVGPDALYTALRRTIVQLAAKYAVPTMYVLREFPKDGGLISYGPDLANAYRETGIYVARVLKGENPAGIPVSLPTKYVLAINTKTAKSLNINIPDRLLALADEVIE